jgi:hypothetical protein
VILHRQFTDFRDLALADFADQNARLQERVISLEDDVETYRQITCAAFTALHDLTIERNQLRVAYHRTLDAYRALRVRVALTTEAA